MGGWAIGAMLALLAQARGESGEAVWLWNPKRGVQAADEVRHLAEGDELRRVRVEPGQRYSISFFAEDKEGIYEIDERFSIIHQSHHCHIMAVMVSDSLGPLSIEHFKVFFHNSNFLLL